MALTDEERASLKKLSQDELIDVLDGLRESAAKQLKAEKDKIVKDFLNGTDRDEEGEEESADIFDIKKNAAFQRLRKQISGR